MWYARAAAAGDGSALYDLAMMLLEGEGGSKDEAQGQALLLEAATLGYAMAQKVLSYAYQDGAWGFPADPTKAQHWRNLSAQGIQV